MHSQPFDSPKILIADDDPSTRLLLRTAMVQWGYQVVEANNGEEAWDILQKPNPPQILILDWIMPKLDGISLCRRIEKELIFRPYIIFLTSMTGADNAVMGLEAGADEFILKPFELTDLRIRVFAGERIIKSRHQLQEASLILQEIQELLTNVVPVVADLSLQQHIQKLQKQINEFNKNRYPNVQPFKLALTKNVTSHINIERMQDFFGSNKQAIKEFVNSFIVLSLGQLEQIKNAIFDKNVESMKYYFHLLGGASANSGIIKIGEYCLKGEECAKTQDWEAARQIYQALLILIEELKIENQ